MINIILLLIDKEEKKLSGNTSNPPVTAEKQASTAPANPPATTARKEEPNDAYNDDIITFSVKNNENVITLSILLPLQEINLYWDNFIESINYKHFFVDDSDKELGDLIILSTKVPSKRDRSNLEKDIEKGKYGDCCVIDNQSVRIHIKDGKKGLYEPFIRQKHNDIMIALKKHYYKGK